MNFFLRLPIIKSKNNGKDQHCKDNQPEKGTSPNRQNDKMN